MDATRPTSSTRDSRTRAERARSQPGSLAATFAGATLVPFLFGGAVGAVVEAALSLVVRRVEAPFVVAVPLLAVGYAIVATGVFALVLRGAVRDALEGLSWQGRWDSERWRARTGRQIPATPRGLGRWLNETRDRPDLDLERIEPLVFLRRLDEAEALVARLPQETAWQRFERRAIADWIQFVRIGPADLDPLRRLAGELVEPEERLRAEAMLAVAESRHLPAFGRATDWLRPLADLRRRLGRRADRILWRDFVPGRFKAYLVVGVVLGVAMAIGLPTTGA